jgi:hypothetical protein
MRAPRRAIAGREPWYGVLLRRAKIITHQGRLPHRRAVANRPVTTNQKPSPMAVGEGCAGVVMAGESLP